ncbi:MAG: DnaD domain protein [Chloroflexota bacterium]|nr:DnaD domain protein [Chloroflexota bacterium]
MPIPEIFFTVLLPEIEDSAELKVTLHLFWLLAQKQGNPRCVSGNDLLADHVLLRGLKRRGDPRSPEDRLQQGLELALARGTLLRIHLRLVSEGNEQAEIIEWYFFNTPRSRKVVNELQGGQILPARLFNAEGEQIEQESEIAVATGTRTHNNKTEKTRTVQVQVERPNIFVLYEQNIGLLSPLIADQLKDAADQYPPEWIEAAFREAVQHNKRNWSYISAILRRWETEGRQQWKA